VEITVAGGDGRSGVVSFRREKYVPRGGPDGGDGGNGGNVVLVADLSVRTLKEMGRRRMYRAERGQHGEGADRHGRSGEDLLLRVPVGTEVSELQVDGSLERITDLVEQGQAFVAARGGAGGWGNSRFATSVHRAPRIAQKGHKGEARRLRLDLKLLADVGIAGLPNAGKSTLLRAISAARPRVADYPFTTLEPALGVVELGYERFVVADIPGLIEGAHRGAGLGLDFLRHIERTRLILHLVDGSRDDPLADMEAVNEELARYSEALAGREQIVAVNKLDLPEVRRRRAELARALAERGIEPAFISAAGGEGVQDLVARLGARLQETAPAPAEVAAPVIRPRPLGRGVEVRREDGAFRVAGERVVAFAEMMPVDVEEGRAELWRRLGRWGVTAALRRAGVRRGDRVRLGAVEVEYEG